MRVAAIIAAAGMGLRMQSQISKPYLQLAGKPILAHTLEVFEGVKEIQEVKMDWIRSNLKRGLKIPEPRTREFSGQIRLRISPSIHRLLSYRAEIENLSLNQYMAMTLAQAVGHYSEPQGITVKKGSRRKVGRKSRSSV